MPSWPALRGRVAALKETLLYSGEEIEYHLRVGVPNRNFWLQLTLQGDDLTLGSGSVPADQEEVPQNHGLSGPVDPGRHSRPNEYRYCLSEGESGVT